MGSEKSALRENEAEGQNETFTFSSLTYNLYSLRVSAQEVLSEKSYKHKNISDFGKSPHFTGKYLRLLRSNSNVSGCKLKPLNRRKKCDLVESKR